MEERKGKEDRKDDQQTNKCNMPSSQPKRSRFKFRILSSSEHSYTEDGKSLTADSSLELPERNGTLLTP